MSLFITFEGGEGCGKSTQARALYRRLSQLAVPVLLTQEPGGTPLGKTIARWLKWSLKTEISPLTELMLFNASRTQLVSDIIMPNLKNGVIVICDRYTDSTIAYQSYGRRLDLQTVLAVNNTATQGLRPDLTILLDMPVDAGFARKGLREKDRFEQETIAFHQRVHDGYHRIAKSDPARWLLVDATLSRATITAILWDKVARMIARRV